MYQKINPLDGAYKGLLDFILFLIWATSPDGAYSIIAKMPKSEQLQQHDPWAWLPRESEEVLQ
jgi:hypothetical protein